MNIRKRLSSLSAIMLFLFVSTVVLAQNETQTKHYTWPIKGAQPGEGIIYKPQDYIGQELNFADLFIEAPEGTIVLAPCDGEISSLNYSFNQSLSYMTGMGLGEYDPSMDTVENIAEYIAEYDLKYRTECAAEMSESLKATIDPKFVSLSIGIDCGQGEKVYIVGLRPLKYFKTGTKIKQGDPIGTVGHSYKAIAQPSINLSKSIHGQSDDPMTVFGLETSFIPPDAPKIDYQTHQHPVTNLLADFEVFKAALEEGHPGLYDYTSQTDMNALFASVKSRINRPMTSPEYLLLLLEVINKVMDSHTGLGPKAYSQHTGAYPPALVGYKDGALTVFSTFPENADLLDKEVVSINGENIDALLQQIKLLFPRPDGYAESLAKSYLFAEFWRYYGFLKNMNEGDSYNLVFTDGTTAKLKYRRLTANIYNRINKKPRSDGRFETKMINDHTALVDLNTFQLLEKDEESIYNFIQGLIDKSCPNLIIDLRHNPGGSPEVVNNLFAILANEPFRSESANMVKNNDTYQLFANTDNYSTATRNMFPEFTEHRADGFYRPDSDFPYINPNPDMHYSGNVYVLINSRSISAATVFPALVHKYQRGIIVGQESGSSYYHLNAMKFAHVRLKNSGLEMRIPLMKIIFEEKGNSDIPWGRGVLPDHTMSLNHRYEDSEDHNLNYIVDQLISQ